LEQKFSAASSDNTMQLELLRKLLDSPEWRQQFLENPQATLQTLGLDTSILESLEVEKNSEEDSQPVGDRQSKSAWFGGNPFG
jgi:hypothetical protein